MSERVATEHVSGEHVSWTGPRVAGLVILALGVACLIATFAINDTGDGFNAQGPRFAPLIGSIALIVLALAFLARTVVRPDTELAVLAAREQQESDARTPAMLIALLLGYAALMTALGYALATTVFVWLTAWLLGSDKPVRDGIVAVALGVVVSFAFSRLLGVRLPEGPWGV
jgi:putative tricarboxylic transport membrane protein